VRFEILNSGDTEDYHYLGCDVMWPPGYLPIFGGDVLRRSETSVNTYQIRRHILEERHLHNCSKYLPGETEENNEFPALGPMIEFRTSQILSISCDFYRDSKPGLYAFLPDMDPGVSTIML
jgi:hypothetical protein